MTFDELVRLGAQQLMSEIQAEVAALEGFLQEAERAPVANTQQVVARKRWTTAQREAVSVRMKAYWAARRPRSTRSA